MPTEARAERLFERLNHRFFHFVDQLPKRLKIVARLKSTFLGGPAEGEFEGVAGLNPVLAGTPWLFWEQCRDLEDDSFLNIAEAGTMYVLASILLDHLVDGQADPQEEIALLQQAFWAHGVGLYRRQFANHTPFWGHFDRLAGDHVAGLAKELETQNSFPTIELEHLQMMAHGKVSPIITTMAAFAEASGRPEMLVSIEESLNNIAIASQLLDDVGDWEHDSGSGHWTFYLSQIALPGKADDLDRMREAIDSEWHDVNHLRLVIHWLDESSHAVEGMNCPGWLAYIGGYRQLTNDHLTAAIAHHLMRTLRPLVQSKNK